MVWILVVCAIVAVIFCFAIIIEGGGENTKLCILLITVMLVLFFLLSVFYPRQGTVTVFTKDGPVSYEIAEYQLHWWRGNLVEIELDDGTVVGIHDTYELRWN